MDVQTKSPDLATMHVDQVGSFLRSSYLKDAFAAAAKGRISYDELRAAQDRAITEIVERQAAVGMPVIGDGEFRRWHFMECFEIAGLTRWTSSWTRAFKDLGREGSSDDRSIKHGANPVLMVREPVTERLELERNTCLDEFRFAQALTERPVKVTFIGPDRIVQGYADDDPANAYPNVDAFVADLVAAERQIIAELAAAGCRYVQVDEPGYTGYVDPPSVAEMRARGVDIESTIQRSIDADNALIAGHPGVTFATHLCRGNRQSMWHREGTYDSIAEQLFTQLGYDRFLLEYDTERAGTFAPLRFVPKGKTVVLGIITTKTGEPEKPDELICRVEEATRYLPVEQLAISPQCGFATDIKGNLLSEDEQWRKLELMLEVANRIWS